MIDQDGVIPMKFRDGRNHEPTNEIVSVLNQLSMDPQNIIFLVSPESKTILHQQYYEKATKLGLAAENGFFWRFSSRNKNETEWN